jgi:putative exosortase-associated protein (TIGR04073 family)
MKKSILLVLLMMAASALVGPAIPEAWSAETWHASHVGTQRSFDRAWYHVSDPCVENYDGPASGNACEHFYVPRTTVDPSVPSTTTGPYYDNNCNERRSRKLFRGIANVTMAVGEIPAGAFREAYATSPVTGAVVGGVHGVFVAAQRIGIGLFEIATFPIPMNQKPTGESVIPADYPGRTRAIAAPAGTTFDHSCWGSRESVDGCCDRTRGTFDPYIEPEVVWMDVLPRSGY